MSDMAIKVFKSEQFGEIRTTVIDGEPWFVVADVCKYFGVTNRNRVMQSVADEDKGGTQMDTPGGVQTVAIVNESGLYSLLFALQPTKARGVDMAKIEERAAQVKAFKHWVTHDVLPDIRKHGMYMTGETITKLLSDPRNAIELLTAYAEEKEKNKRLEETVKVMQPKAEFSDAINSSHDGILVKQMAHLLTMNGYSTGQNRLFEQLRKDGFVCSCKGARYNSPTQSSIDRGLMVSRETHFNDANGITHLDFTTLITPKGQRFFLRKYANKVLSDEEIAAMLEEEERDIV